MEEMNFRTLKGYDLKNARTITRSMEDYLEMIFRMAQKDGFVRISTLAFCLNVKASSASKMVGNLKENGLVEFERYGVVRLTEKGKKLGEYLLYRHDVLNRFFCMINQTEEELEQTEQIEHFMNRKTVENIEKWMEKIEEIKQTDLK